jgi:hypothetical protein
VGTIRACYERRTLVDQRPDQLVAAEEKMTAMNQKNASTDSKREARVKEYESRLKAAEERVKRERQRSKVAELENNLKLVPPLPFFCLLFFL